MTSAHPFMRAIAHVNAHMATLTATQVFHSLLLLPSTLVRAQLDWRSFCAHFRRREALPADLWVHTWGMLSVYGETVADEIVAMREESKRVNDMDGGSDDEAIRCRNRMRQLLDQRHILLTFPRDLASQRAALATSSRWLEGGVLQRLWHDKHFFRLVSTLSPQLTAEELRLHECIRSSTRLIDVCEPRVAMLLLQRYGVVGAGVHGSLFSSDSTTTLVHLCDRNPEDGAFPVVEYILQHLEGDMLQAAEDGNALQRLCVTIITRIEEPVSEDYIRQARNIAVQLVRRIPSCNPCSCTILCSPLGEAAIQTALERRSAESLCGDIRWDLVLGFIVSYDASGLDWVCRLLGVELRTLFADVPRAVCHFWHILLSHEDVRARAAITDWPAFLRRHMHAPCLTRMENNTSLMCTLLDTTWPALLDYVLQEVPVAQWAPYAPRDNPLVVRLCGLVHHPAYYEMLLRIATWTEPHGDEDDVAATLDHCLPPELSLLDSVLQPRGVTDVNVLTLVQAMHAKWGPAVLRPSQRSLGLAHERRYTRTAAWLLETYGSLVALE